MKRIITSDFSLRCTDQNRKLIFRERVDEVELIDNAGVDIIELPAVCHVKEDRIINRTISEAVKNARIMILGGYSREEIRNSYESIRTANKPAVLVALPVSTVCMEYAFHIKNESMLDKIKDLVSYARTLCDDVQFEAVDATRADRDFLFRCLKTAFDCGASSLSLTDETGEILPSDVRPLVSSIKESVQAPLFVKLNDSIGLGYANVIASLEGGADGIKGTFSEGTGINFARLTRILPVIEKKVMARTGIDDTRAATQSGKIQSGRKTAHEIGKGDKTVSLSSFSDIDDVRRSAVLLGYDLSEDDLRKVLDSVQRVCKKKDEVGKREFEAIIASSAMQVPSTYHIDSYFTSSSNISSSVSRVVLMRDGEKIEGFASGDGPVDASFLAIERCVGHHYELDDFQIQAVTEGRESLGSALVKLRSNGNLYSGNGLSTDIVGASIRAYIDALNKIIWMEEKR